MWKVHLRKETGRVSPKIVVIGGRHVPASVLDRASLNVKTEHRQNMLTADGSNDGLAAFDSSNGEALVPSDWMRKISFQQAVYNFLWEVKKAMNKL